MKRKTLIRCAICLLAVLIVGLSFIGFSRAKYARSYTVTQSLSVNIAANQYTLTLDANGGAFADSSPTKTKTVAYKGTYGDLDAPARGGYAFDGWYTAKAGGTKIDANDTVEITQNTTIYAHWTANTYTVAYNANGGTGSMDDTAATYGQSATLRANAFAKTGYSFAGWNTKADGTGTSYADEASVINLSTSGTVTLYAQWKINTYTINLYSNLLYGLEDTQSEVIAEGIKYTISDRVITGTGISTMHPEDCYGLTTGRVMLEAGKTYRFTTKHTGSSYGGYSSDVQVFLALDGAYDTVEHMGSTNMDLTASTSGEYWLRLDVNFLGDTQRIYNVNVAEDVGTIDVTYGGTYSALPTLTRTGYTFLNWQDEDGNVFKTSTPVTQTADHSLFAQWEANRYTVIFNANEGSGTMSSQLFSYDMAQNLTANAFSRTGYGFTGWNTAADGSGTEYADEAAVSNLTTAPNGNVVLYAQWVSQNYTVRFDANGGSGTMEDMDAVYDQALTLTANSFTRDGYKFIGWNTKADGSGTTYADRDSVMNLPSSDGSVAVLYAQWETLDTYTLIYDANGGTNAPAAQIAYADAVTQSHTFDITADIPAYISPSGVAYTFLGWSEDPALTAALQYSADGANAEDATQMLKTTVTLEKSGKDTTKTLYAVWGVTYKLSYDAGSGTGVPASVEQFGRLTGCTFNVDYSVRPVWADHEFRYWTTNIHYITGEEIDHSVMYPEDSQILIAPAHSSVTLYGRYYNKGALTITYHENVPYSGVVYNMPVDDSITADIEKQTVPYSISYNVKPTVKMSGKGNDYQLLGWSTSPDAREAEFTVGQDVLLNRLNDQATVLYAVWDVVPIITCADFGDNEKIYLNKSSYTDQTTADGYYWNTRCVSWVSHSDIENPENISASFYLPYINTKTNVTVKGFTGTKDGTTCDVLDLVDETTGLIDSSYSGTIDLNQTMWEEKIYDAEKNAYFIPVYAVYDEFVYVYQNVYYAYPESTSQALIHNGDHFAHYLASIYETGDVKLPLFYSSGEEFVTKGFWCYVTFLRDGKEYEVAGWAWDPEATTPDGKIIDANGAPPVSGTSGNVYTHLTYDQEVFMSANDEERCEVYQDATRDGVTCYAYNFYIIYKPVTSANTFKILLNYKDGEDFLPNSTMGAVTTQADSYTYASKSTDQLHYSCDYTKGLPTDSYEIVGWTLDRDTLSFDLRQYPVGHTMNSNYEREAIYVTDPPLTISTEDAYDAEGDFYYKRFYAIYAKTIRFAGNYTGTVLNVPEAVSAYTHYGFDNNTAAITLPDNIPTRSEALFLGWATEPDGEVVYKPGETVSVTAASTTLYAVWQKNYNYQLYYDWNDGTGNKVGPLNYSASVSHMGVAIINDLPVREGYTFLGWAETSDAETPAYTNIAQDGTASTIIVTATVPNETTVKTLYAVWEQKTV